MKKINIFFSLIICFGFGIILGFSLKKSKIEYIIQNDELRKNEELQINSYENTKNEEQINSYENANDEL